MQDRDWFYQADSIEELGKAIAADVESFDVDGFVKTVEAYNAAAGGADDEYGKPQQFIWPLQTAPFYAAKVGVNAYNTNGIHINTAAQVGRSERPMVCTRQALQPPAGDSQVYGGGTNQPVALWCSCAAARHIVESRLGKTVAEDWMGDVPMTSILGEDYANGNPLG